MKNFLAPTGPLKQLPSKTLCFVEKIFPLIVFVYFLLISFLLLPRFHFHQINRFSARVVEIKILDRFPFILEFVPGGRKCKSPWNEIYILHQEDIGRKWQIIEESGNGGKCLGVSSGAFGLSDISFASEQPVNTVYIEMKKKG